MRESWRAVVAALANDRLRIMYAEIIAGTKNPNLASRLDHKDQQTLMRLTVVGLLTKQPDGSYTVNTGIFKEVLRLAPVQPRERGIERFLREGRIEQYPASATERRKLLEWIQTRIISQDESLPESEINERLLTYTDDAAVLRRYLVDHSLLVRTPDGTSYSMPAPL